jgi:hypothetical protein
LGVEKVDEMKIGAVREVEECLTALDQNYYDILTLGGRNSVKF